MIRAVVGAGGKTTFIKNEVKDFLAKGRKVFVTTSTHMYIEEDTLLTDDAEEIIKELEQKRYVMAGQRQGVKIAPLSKETYEKVCKHADEVFIEADGSRQLPLKFPNEKEPVIYENVEEIVVIGGLHAIGQRAGDAIQRLELSKLYGVLVEENTIITPEIFQEILEKGYRNPLQQKFPDKKIRMIGKDRIPVKVGCIIMASGLSKRFGRNKLLATIHGKTFIQQILDLTEGLFEKRMVLTRSKEVEDICKDQDIAVILHDKEGRNEAIALGIEEMPEMDGWIFCPCDQPFLRRESLIQIRYTFARKGNGIFRLAYQGIGGTPILFSKEYFTELRELPDQAGGSYLAKKYPEEVTLIPVSDELELFDIDTPEEYQMCYTNK